MSKNEEAEALVAELATDDQIELFQKEDVETAEPDSPERAEDAIDVGAGFSKKTPTQGEEADTPQENVLDVTQQKPPEPGVKFSDAFDDVPSLANQLTDFPDSCRFSGKKISVFKIGTDQTKDNQEYMSLMDRTVPDGCPRVIVTAEDKQFHEGNWVVLVEYCNVQYRKLSPKELREKP